AREIESLRADVRGLSQLAPRPAMAPEPAPILPPAPSLSPRPGLAAADGPAHANEKTTPWMQTPVQAPPSTPAAAAPRKSFSLEQLLGGRAFAWVGALAIALS